MRGIRIKYTDSMYYLHDLHGEKWLFSVPSVVKMDFYMFPLCGMFFVVKKDSFVPLWLCARKIDFMGGISLEVARTLREMKSGKVII